MRHILDLRPDIIKFDISLTRNVDRDPVRKALAAALGVFAQHAGTTVTAEGIETQAELDVLRQLGFHSGQGYLLGRPETLADLFDLQRGAQQQPRKAIDKTAGRPARLS